MSETDGNGRRVLIVDDEQPNRELMARIMKFNGVQFDHAENGLVAVDKWLKGNYSLIFMDINMPVMGGYEAVRYIRSHEKEKKAVPIPIVAVTSVPFSGGLAEVGPYGFSHYIEKPFRVSQLINTMTYFLKDVNCE